MPKPFINLLPSPNIHYFLYAQIVCANLYHTHTLPPTHHTHPPTHTPHTPSHPHTFLWKYLGLEALWSGDLCSLFSRQVLTPGKPCKEGCGHITRGVVTSRGVWSCHEGCGHIMRGLVMSRGVWSHNEGFSYVTRGVVIMRGLVMPRGVWSHNEGFSYVTRGMVTSRGV